MDKIIFLILPNQLFDIKKNFSWDINKPIDPSLRWLRSDTVVVNMNKKK